MFELPRGQVGHAANEALIDVGKVVQTDTSVKSKFFDRNAWISVKYELYMFSVKFGIWRQFV